MDLLSMFTPEQIEALKVQLLANNSGRSPIKPRQLHDLRMLPTKDDPRPLFIMSAETPRDFGDVSKTHPYPALLWHRDTGEEITVQSAKERATYGAEWKSVPPVDRVLTPMEDISELLAGLTEHERSVVLEAQNRQRMESLQSRLAELTPEQLAALVAGLPQPKAVPGQKRTA